jgi:hypothetical protein
VLRRARTDLTLDLDQVMEGGTRPNQMTEREEGETVVKTAEAMEEVIEPRATGNLEPMAINEKKEEGQRTTLLRKNPRD